MIFASFFIFDSTVSKKMDHFDISFACSFFSKSWEVTNYGFLDVAHLPRSHGCDGGDPVSGGTASRVAPVSDVAAPCVATVSGVAPVSGEAASGQ